MRKILENLNKLSLPATILIASIVLGGSYFATQISKQLSIEKQQQIELQAKSEKESLAALEKEQEKVEADSKHQQDTQVAASISRCMTDAYAELQTLQDNLERVYLNSCSVSISSAGCNSEWVSKTKKDWLTRYQQEWVPQCKLGKRVFIHTEPYYP